ncbi:uncharacterized protein BDR25DRAFT_340867 [Lindgomyces ingoldianus]|uniref:Uncharacterized protein n=1 Tax=Lindgomyces ingoldianus TaxID=673940 RepID=A0ACB6R6G8_9PLEO|nr:uncharacterized protein BDR25DRAFT_340867 [Lindgomyces ingoldianus]KAF2474370.1 hypothetical protein BDR25DRAFT_340867 [Lindgomyces ingoldianus]
MVVLSEASTSLHAYTRPRLEDDPGGDSLYLAPGKDAAFYESLLVQHESRLFETDESIFEIIRLLHDNERSIHGRIEIQTISDMGSLVVQLERQRSKGEQLFFIIPQLYSWGQLQITREAFQRILVCQQVSTPFLNVVNEFGSKIRHEFPRCNTSFFCSRMDSWPNLEGQAAYESHHDYELSYILQFVERNGRNRGNPWSIRQTGVYQQAKLDNRQSVWIFLQVSTPTRGVLEDKLRRQLSCHGESDSPVALHALLLRATAGNWGEYVRGLSAQLRDLDEKACFSKIGIVAAHDYSVTFADMQALQILRHKILTVSLILSSCLDVAARLTEHCHKLDGSGFSPKSEQVRKSIEMYAADIRVHQQSVGVLMEALQGTYGLLSKIIEFRNIESLRHITEASERHLVSLEDLTLRIRNENRDSATLASHAQKDTKAMKALTTMATTLLPASLIATIFSSNLVQLKQDSNSDGQKTHFVIATQFWIYVVVTLALTIIILGCTRLLERQWIRSLF